MRSRRKSKSASTQVNSGWDVGKITAIQIQRRKGRHAGKRYIPSGWDLVDVHTNQLMSEWNDETAPPKEDDQFRHALGLREGVRPQNGNELGEMFKEIYRICYDTTIEAMRLMASALPEHEDSNDGEPIAQIVISAFNRLPETAQITKKEAMNAQYPF